MTAWVIVLPMEATGIRDDLGLGASVVYIALERRYLLDPAFPVEDLHFVLAREVGKAKLSLDGSALAGHAREFAADSFAAGLVGREGAAASIGRIAEWHRHNKPQPSGDEAARPSTAERIRNVLAGSASTSWDEAVAVEPSSADPRSGDRDDSSSR